MSVDVSKIKIGDVLTIRVEVRRVDAGASLPVGVRCCDDCAHLEEDDHLWPSCEDILSHTPKDLAVGDRVRHAKDLVMEWEVVAPPRSTNSRPGQRVAVWSGDHGYAVFDVDDLERLP